jgi:hypothetical protein
MQSAWRCCALRHIGRRSLHRRVGPPRPGHFSLRPHVDGTAAPNSWRTGRASVPSWGLGWRGTRLESGRTSRRSGNRLSSSASRNRRPAKALDGRIAPATTRLDQVLQGGSARSHRWAGGPGHRRGAPQPNAVTTAPRTSPPQCGGPGRSQPPSGPGGRGDEW